MTSPLAPLQRRGDNNSGGNPAGVVLNADQLTYDQKLSIAKQAGFSETAFISKSEIADFKFDFFTPSKQIAHCGHATIGAFSYLKQTGYISGTDSSKETIDGIRKIKLVGDLAFMEQRAPTYIDVKHEADRILHSMGISYDDLQPGLYPAIVNTGNAFLIIPLKNSIHSHLKWNKLVVMQLPACLVLIMVFLKNLLQAWLPVPWPATCLIR